GHPKSSRATLACSMRCSGVSALMSHANGAALSVSAALMSLPPLFAHAEKCPHFLEEPRPCRLVLEQHVILAVERNEAHVGNACGELPALLEGDHRLVAPRPRHDDHQRVGHAEHGTR